MNDTTTDATHSALPHASKEGDTLLKNVVDFLGFIYGNKSIVRDEKQELNAAHTVQPVGHTGQRLSTRASLYKKALGTVQPSRGATEAIVPSASSETEKVQDAKNMGENDYIEQLLNHLMRTYSTQKIPEDFAATGKEWRSNYVFNSGEKNALAQFSSVRNIPKEGMDMSNFVNQTLDCFLRPGAQLNSTCSVLSNLEMDPNFVNMLSFNTRSSLQNTVDDAEEITETLKPMFFGKQAMFKSVASIPQTESIDRSSSTIRVSKMSIPHLPLIRKGGAAGVGSTPVAMQSLTLDSKEFGPRRRSGSLDDFSEGAEVRSTPSSDPAAHALPNPTDISALAAEMVNRETLSRNILLALEQQLRGVRMTDRYNRAILHSKDIINLKNKTGGLSSHSGIARRKGLTLSSAEKDFLYFKMFLLYEVEMQFNSRYLGGTLRVTHSLLICPMLTRCPINWMRVLCLTMIPGGGAMTPALARLGYTPYHLMTCFQDGHASAHAAAWAGMLDGTRAYNSRLFATHDSLVGPPAAGLYDRILRECPGFTKVVLVVEPRKDAWAAEYDACVEGLGEFMRRIGSSKKFNAAFTNMVGKMVVQGGRDQVHSPSMPIHGKRSVDGGGCSGPEVVRPSAASKVPEEDFVRGEAAGNGPKEGPATSPRAIALWQFEESVKMRVPAGRLLVYRYGDGWGPLCAFLEKPIPDEPFPAYDNGLRMLTNLVEKVLFIELVRKWVTRLFGLCLFFMLLPYFRGGATYFHEMFRECSIAFGRDSHSGAVAKSVEASPPS